jgi:uncharacterized membrane protein YesL
MARRGDPVALQDILIVAYYDLGALILVNLIWFLLTLPVITAVPALGGLYYATNHHVHHKSADWRTFVEGFRAHFWLSWRWGLLNAASFGILAGGVWFYGSTETAWARWVQAVLVGIAMLWALIQVYTFPLLLEQRDRRLRVAMRNSLVMLVRLPLPTVANAIIIAALVLFSTWAFRPAWIFLTGSLCAYLANRAVIEAIKQLGAHASSPEPASRDTVS